MKHRLVGAAVLVGLGIIAWPVVFDTTPVREISQRSQIPAPPAGQPFIVPDPQPVEPLPEPDSTTARAQLPDMPASEEAPPAEDAPMPAPTGAAAAKAPSASPARDPVAPVRTDASGLPEQWAVQLGVFSARENALELRARAEKAGFHALVQTTGSGAARRFRVYAEPKLDRATAQRAAASLQQKLGIKGYVTRYYP